MSINSNPSLLTPSFTLTVLLRVCLFFFLFNQMNPISFAEEGRHPCYCCSQEEFGTIFTSTYPEFNCRECSYAYRPAINDPDIVFLANNPARLATTPEVVAAVKELNNCYEVEVAQNQDYCAFTQNHEQALTKVFENYTNYGLEDIVIIGAYDNRYPNPMDASASIIDRYEEYAIYMLSFSANYDCRTVVTRAAYYYDSETGVEGDSQFLGFPVQNNISGKVGVIVGRLSVENNPNPNYESLPLGYGSHAGSCVVY